MSGFKSGIDAFAKQLREVAEFSKEMERRKIEVRYDPDDAASVEQAVREIERNVEQAASRYSGNPQVRDLARSLKEAQVKQYREQAKSRQGKK